MTRLEALDGKNWEEFTQAPAAVLLLGKTDCAACNEWTDELTKFLETDMEFAQVRFGKMLLDKPGLVSFKKASPWLAEVDALPFNVIYVNGNKEKTFAGGGMDRLTNRLKRLIDAA